VPSELIVGEIDFMRVDCDKARYVEVVGTLTDPVRNKHCHEKSESWLLVPSTTKAASTETRGEAVHRTITCEECTEHNGRMVRQIWRHVGSHL
jgi:hypothetical protein